MKGPRRRQLRHKISRHLARAPRKLRDATLIIAENFFVRGALIAAHDNQFPGQLEQSRPMRKAEHRGPSSSNHFRSAAVRNLSLERLNCSRARERKARRLEGEEMLGIHAIGDYADILTVGSIFPIAAQPMTTPLQATHFGFLYTFFSSRHNEAIVQAPVNQTGPMVTAVFRKFNSAETWR